jgi:hypothetical protein
MGGKLFHRIGVSRCKHHARVDLEREACEQADFAAEGLQGELSPWKSRRAIRFELSVGASLLP